MRRALIVLAALATGATASTPISGDERLALKMWRLDCGTLIEPAASSLPWNRRDMPVSCYLIQHGQNYLLWDAGVSARALGIGHPTIKLKRTLTDQLAQIGVMPEKVGIVAISHYHGDHTGQASTFPKARLIIGAEDLAALRRSPPPTGSAPTHLAPWLSGQTNVTPLTEDLDVFGDGRVTVLMTRGHTPGHISLLVKLSSRPVALTGDLWATHENVLTDDMPAFNTSFAETAASRERFRRIVRELKAMVVIQHEADDVAKLPPFPAYAQ